MDRFRRKRRAKPIRASRDFDAPLLQGKYEAHRNGFGFCIIEGVEKDYHISRGRSLDAMNGDIVEIRPMAQAGSQHRGLKEAEVVRVIERSTSQIVGTYERISESNKSGFVIPDDPRFNRDIYIPFKGLSGIRDGEKVLVRILDFGSRDKKPTGEIVETLGMPTDPGVDIDAVVRSHEIPTEFPENVLKQAANVDKPVNQSDIEFRKDLRGLTMITIDGEDSKDLDDAVSLIKEDGIFELGVHIADVANYVQERSALDREALKRGNSVYLPDRVIPMLPKRLSNGICSLNAGEERLALSCTMRIDSEGRVLDSKVEETVILVDRRMTYNEVFDLLEDRADLALKSDCAGLINMLQDMLELSRILRKKRMGNGAIDFDFPESKVILDDNLRAVKIESRESNIATRIIEEFMLCANETIARTFYYQEVPFIYRSHEQPDIEKLRVLSDYAASLGAHFRVPKDKVHPGIIQKLIESVRGTPKETMIGTVALRSMKQARYTTDPIGHFGLSMEYYCHFTSPIRRYPDLQVHRIIKAVLRGKMTDEKVSHFEEILPEVAKHSSETERLAETAEREAIKIKKAEYMEGHLGETFVGTVTSITNFGMYVTLDNTVEGLIRFSDMTDDHYIFYEKSYELFGERTGKTYALGDSIRVVASYVDRTLGEIGFLPRKDDSWHRKRKKQAEQTDIG